MCRFLFNTRLRKIFVLHETRGVEGKWKRKEEVEIKANSSGRVNGKKLINIMFNAMGMANGGLCGCENVQSPTEITD